LRRLHAKADDILERFALLACIAVVWAFAAILTVAGAYNNSKARTQTSSRFNLTVYLSSFALSVNL
jgi:nucleobase transporter 1/2